MNAKFFLMISLLFISGCSSRTMNIEQGDLTVVTKESVEAYDLRQAGWNWDKQFITDELIKITILSDKDLFLYSLNSKNTIRAYAFFCGKQDVKYPLNVDLYVGGKSFLYWYSEYKNVGKKPNAPIITHNGKTWYAYETLAVSRFTQDRETPDSEPESGKVEFYGKYDFREPPADLCMMITGYAGGVSSEESNVLIIKKEDIKKAFGSYKK